MKYYQVLSDVGSGEISLQEYDPKSAQVAIGSVIRFVYRGGERGAFFVEKPTRDPAKPGDHTEQFISYAGRGVMVILDDGIIYHAEQGNPIRQFVDMSLAGMLITLMEEAQERGCFPDLSWDFTGELDSHGEAWGELFSLDLRVGTSLLEIMRQFAALGVDFTFDPDYTLHAYRQAGIDRGDDVVFRVGQNCESCTHTEDAAGLKNSFLVEGQNNVYFTLGDAASQAQYRRREAPFSAGQAPDNTQAQRLAEVELETKKDPQATIAVKLIDAEGILPRVFNDYDLGDWVKYDPGTGTLSPYRIRGLMLEWDPDGYASVTVELNSLEIEVEIRSAMSLKRLAPGVSGCVSPTATPADFGQALAYHNADAEAHPNMEHDASKLQGVDVSAAAPSDGDSLVYDGAEEHWEPRPPTGPGSFVGLTDTPDSYTDQAGKAPIVNEDEDELEFVDIATQEELEDGLAGKSDTGHTHAENYVDIDGDDMTGPLTLPELSVLTDGDDAIVKHRAGTQEATSITVPITGTETAADGAYAWDDESKITTINNDPAYCAVGTGSGRRYSYFLIARISASQLPAGAIITGFRVQITRRYSTASGATDYKVQGIYSTTLAGDNKAVAGSWGSSYSTITYGGDGDKWGLSWSTADVNSGNCGFGVQFYTDTNTIGQVDCIAVTIYYTLSPEWSTGVDHSESCYAIQPGTVLGADAYRFYTNGQLKVPALTGTSPLAVTSTTVVTNLNVDMLDGYHASELGATHTHDDRYYTETETTNLISTHAALQTGVHGLSITAGKTLTVQESITLTGTAGGITSLAVLSGKTLTLTATDNYNLTISATGTAALLGVANVFTLGATFNETGANADFRIESQAYTHMFFVDASASKIGVNYDSPAHMLDIVTGFSSVGIRATNVTTDDTAKYFPMRAWPYHNADGEYTLFLGYSASNHNYARYGGGTSTANACTDLYFYTAVNTTTVTGTLRMSIDADGVMIINDSGIATADVRIEGDTNANLFLLDAGDDTVNIGGASVSARYDLALLGRGCLMMKEITTPTADTNYGKIYCKSNDRIYFQDGAGVEHTLAFV